MLRLAAAVAFCLLAAPLEARQFYVDGPGGSGPGGSDANNCTAAQTITTAKATLANLAANCALVGGDTVSIRGGTYTQQIVSPPMAGTSWLNKVRIENYLTEQVWITPSTCVGDVAFSLEGSQAYVEIDGINVNAINCGDVPAITVIGCNNGTSHHIRWQNSEWIEAYVGAYLYDITGTCQGSNEFTNNRLHSGWDNNGGPCFPGFLPGNGFYVQSDSNVFDGNDVSQWSGNAVQFYNGNGHVVSGGVWRNNKIHGFTYSADCVRFPGVMVANASGTLIYNNVIWGIGGSSESYGIYVLGGSNTAIYNNTVYGGGGWGIRVEAGITGTIVRNNLAFANILGNYISLSGGTTASNNSFSTANPNLKDPGGDDFHLLATSTANIDTGFDLSATFTLDHDGTPYGTFDRGAYAFVGVGESDCDEPCVGVISGGSLDGLSLTTGQIDTTGANLIVMIVASHGVTALPTSSKAGTVEPMTAYSDTGTDIRAYFIQNPSVGTGHSFAVPSNATTTWPSMCVIALSGRATSSVLDQQSGNVDVGSIATVQAGSVTPTSANQVVVAGAHLFQATSATINGGFISPFGATEPWVNGQNAGCQLAYLPQTTATAANPTWTLGGTQAAAGAVLGTFRVFADVALPPPVSGPPRFRHPFQTGAFE